MTATLTRVCAVEDCDDARLARDWCSKHYQRWKTHGDPHVIGQMGGPRPGGGRKWVEDVGYVGAHQRVYKLRGPAANHSCEHCAEPAAEWAYDHTCPNERPDPKRRGPYSADPTHYFPLCIPCHKRFDKSQRALARQNKEG